MMKWLKITLWSAMPWPVFPVAWFWAWGARYPDGTRFSGERAGAGECHRACHGALPGGIIEAVHLPDYLQPAPPPEGMEAREPAASRRGRWEELEPGFLIQVLKDNNWNRQAAAQELGIGRQTLWRKIKRINIHPPKVDGRSSRSKTDRQSS